MHKQIKEHNAQLLRDVNWGEEVVNDEVVYEGRNERKVNEEDVNNMRSFSFLHWATH